MNALSASRRTRGFTLIELMVALAVLAVVAVTAGTRTLDTLVQMQRLEERTLATWLAENELVQLRIAHRADAEPIPAGRRTKEQRMAGRDWHIEVAVLDTDHPWMRRVEVQVAAIDDSGERAPVHELVGFLGQH